MSRNQAIIFSATFGFAAVGLVIAMSMVPPAPVSMFITFIAGLCAGIALTIQIMMLK